MVVALSIVVFVACAATLVCLALLVRSPRPPTLAITVPHGALVLPMFEPPVAASHHTTDDDVTSFYIAVRPEPARSSATPTPTPHRAGGRASQRAASRVALRIARRHGTG